MNSRWALPLWLLFNSMLVCAQTASPAQAPVDFNEDEARAHRFYPLESVRTKHEVPMFSYVAFSVVVSKNGDVESAVRDGEQMLGDSPQLRNALSELREQAQSVIQARRYKPFEKDGVPVRAKIRDYVAIRPLEKWGKTQPLPDVKDWKTVRITLARTTCFGSCPSYEVSVSGSGDVWFTGREYVLVKGQHHSRITRSALTDLVSAFRKANYFSALDSYQYGATDGTTITMSFEADGRKKTVRDYYGDAAGIPSGIEILESKIDESAGTAKWVEGNDETIPGLQAEGWDFKSTGKDNLNLIETAALAKDPTLLRQLIALGAPMRFRSDTFRSDVLIWLKAANGDVKLAQEYLDGGAAETPRELTEALTSAAWNSQPQIVELLLSRGADPREGGWENKVTPVMAAAAAGDEATLARFLAYHPDVNAKDKNGKTALMYVGERETNTDKDQKIEQHSVTVLDALVAAGANPNTRDDEGRTALFSLCAHPQAMKRLLQAGADVNAEDKDGDTALTHCEEPEVTKLLISAGADLTLKNNQHRNAYQQARRYRAEDSPDDEHASIIRAAMLEKGIPLE